MDFILSPQDVLLLGILLQSVTQIRNGTGIAIMFISMCIACISFYTNTPDGRHLLEINPDKIVMFGLVYIFIFSFMSREEMLKKITETQILTLSVIFLLGVFTFLTDTSSYTTIMKIFGVFSVFFFYFLCITKFKLQNSLKLLSYVVFLGMNIALMIMLLSIKDIFQLFNFENIQTVSIFLNGAILFILGTKIVNLLLIFPLPTRLNHIQDSWEIAAEHRNILISKVHDERTAHNPFELLGIIAISIAVYILLSVYVQSILIIQLLLLGSSYFFSFRNKGIISK
ncbi:MAG: hypothetical protein KA035_03175 [Candidatus Levybacteria bacterium]|nr:hypothetical protein [Candidatus Levybacteria bacterium]